MKYNKISLYMTNYEKIADSFIKANLNINSLAIIEEESRIVYSTLNWDVSRDIENINLIWGSKKSKKEKTIQIRGVIYRVIQNTFDKLIAISLNRRDVIIGFKDYSSNSSRII